MDPLTRTSAAKARTVASLLIAFLLLGSCASPSRGRCAETPEWLRQHTNAALAPLLSASIIHSRATATGAGVHSIPEEMRKQLAPFYQPATLERVRWTTSEPRASLDTLIITLFPRYRGMTFDDVIVFRSAPDVGNISLWAHELVHVEQFRRLGGVPQFSRAYLANWDIMEEEAVRRTNRILVALGSNERQVSRMADCGPAID